MTKPTALFERYGPHDDVIVSMRYDLDAVRVIKDLLPPWARAYDEDSRAWRVHPSFAPDLAAKLAGISYTVADRQVDK
jgi:hypothetical protein